ncbi:hypothetical protein B0T16DRAFT_325908 [Cercophora newfieldiana]|uniref:Anaphase-promoting complex subunit 1 n=1 Tax=Cercophora newfieldiana TaxID=92897 RepID=A0AA40CUF5_9PEZI|nr:hypothetical protein B0T16DRAFT_325908 [Cercophora newfieldiana]
MASMTSLGLHQPTGLRRAIAEGILPPDPPAALYSWEVTVDIEGDSEHVHEILTTEKSVLWSRGGFFRKSFTTSIENEPVTQALLAYFPASADNHEPTTDRHAPPNSKCTPAQASTPELSRALVVFLKTQAHIFFLSGTAHIVHMPFEVESACAGPIGVIIQRKSKGSNATPMSLRIPKVPPNSFMSSQLTPFAAPSVNVTEFSTEALGKPKTLPLRLSSTLENMWHSQAPVDTPDSHWPRLVCLTDPLLEIGLVVVQTGAARKQGRRRSSAGSLFLNPAEEILHIQAVNLGSDPEGRKRKLNIAVTVNREINMYSVWKLTYLEHEDPFIGKRKQKKPSASRRRSSMAPGLASGTATPLHPSMRESFGAPLPGKRTRKSVRIEDNDKVLDKALSSLDPEKGTDANRRESRRVSSLLARGDLSTSQDRSTFVDQTLHLAHGSRRVESHGSQRARVSGGYALPSFSGTFNQSLNSLAEAPVDNLLEELRAGGDFEGFHNMGLEDHDFEGLTHEMLFTKIYSIPVDNANVRYSLSTLPARTQSKVFVLVGPPTATDPHGRTSILVGIQDPVDKRLQLLTLFVEKQQAAKANPAPNEDSINIVFGELRRVQSVVDSCKISDGGQSCETIIILSEDKAGGRELSLQSPWGKVTKLALPFLFFDNLASIDYAGSFRTDKETRSRRSIGVGVTGTQIDSICHSQPRGVLDLRDRDGRYHRVRVKLRPSSHQVSRALDACRSVLPSDLAEKVLTGWWQVTQWLKSTKYGVSLPPVDTEWSAFVILVLSSFLALESPSGELRRPRGRGASLSSQSGNWDAMQAFTAPNSSACSPWMRRKGWQWMLEDGLLETPRSPDVNLSAPRSFIAVHTDLARKYLASSEGALAFGSHGYLPTAVNRDQESRNMAAWSIVMGLHLLLEEQRLTILTPEDSSPNSGDLRGLLCQLAKWLKWSSFHALYALDIQTEPDVATNSVTFPNTNLDEPSDLYCVLSWIQAHLTAKPANEFPTLAKVYATASRDTSAETPRHQLWNALTPRTAMFERLFELLRSVKNHVEMVVAMHECGFTARILETLPEAVLTPLQDVIFMCQSNPPSSWPVDLLALVNRTDIAGVLQAGKVCRASGTDGQSAPHAAKWDFRMLAQHLGDLPDQTEETDGTERQAVVRSLFREDRRLNEAQSLLSSTKSRVLKLDPRPEWTESEYLERQKELATTAATSTLAIPAGRGLLYYSLRYPLLTQKYHIGGFNLTCLVKPPNNTVGVDKTLFTEEKINWAFFHQGVAGGLAISPHAKNIDTSWILYNKPGQDLSNRHAGFLLALGLNGHLKSVAKWVAFKYLTPKHTMTSIGLLLGLAASYIGTMDSLITRLLSVHVTRMLPRGAAELNLSKHTQTTGVMGIGLLYCNSQHRRMSEIMMSEIEHIDDGEEEDPLRDEGYRLAAGFALGFINLGKGNDLKGLRDMRLTEKLLTIATSSKRVELVHVLDRSAAAAVVAIALIFMKSEDHIVARKIDVPDSILQFDYVRPDILLLRTMAKNIILWKEVDPTFEWVRRGLPAEYRLRSRLTNVTKLRSRDLPFFSILAGICWSLGLRFAGSANPQVRDVLVHYLDQFIRIVRTPPGNFDSELARGNARMCMDLLALSCSVVMAGTGDLAVLRRLRSLHGRDDANTTYGSHIAAHLAIGALFLGCGTATFGTSDLATASLIVAFYPLFPTSVQDNRSHLQAFRHFWVLATDPRCFVTKDLSTGQPINVPIEIELKAGSPSAIAATATATTAAEKRSPGPVTIRRQTPCLLPPLEDVARLATDASAMGFWNQVIDFQNSPQLVEDFRKTQFVYLRHRPAHESPYPATLLALGSNGVSGDRDPLEWVFSLRALRTLTHSDRAVVMDCLGSGGGVGEGEGATTAVDAKLVLRSGLDGWSRDRLLGLKLLFEWADRRSTLVKPANVPTSAAEDKTHGKAKQEKPKARKGKKKVSLEPTAEEKVTRAPESKVQTATVEKENGWWLRDSTIEELKGMTWLAVRER